MRLVIRADASSGMGTGHLMRCLALAQAWQESGGEVDVVTQCTHTDLVSRFEREGFQVHPVAASQEMDTLHSLGSRAGQSACVLDGYHFGPDYQRTMRELFRPLVMIDDMGDQPVYCADIILNQNLHAPELQYRCEPGSRLLLGTRFALLRREFQRWKNWDRRTEPEAHRILITLGGSDPDNVTMIAVQAIEECLLNEPEVVILVGAANCHVSELREWVHGRAGYRLVVGAEDVAQFMAWADFAVSAAGSTCWEICFMRLPAALVTLADNQAPLARRLSQSGAAVSLGWHSDISAGQAASIIMDNVLPLPCRQAMSRLGRELVDGEGAVRVVHEILAFRN